MTGREAAQEYRRLEVLSQREATAFALMFEDQASEADFDEYLKALGLD
jgi:hypothetical protein